MANYTKGEWKAGNTDVVTDTTHIANCYFESRNFKLPPFNEALANAHLIASAVNACASVNPDNPMAVAESIKDMYEALKEIKFGGNLNQYNETIESLQYVLKAISEICDKALAKAEGKEV